MAERKEKEEEKSMEIRYIPSEIVEEILHKLPCKSLVRLMSTSKLWHSLATDRDFIRSHQRRSVSNPSHLLFLDLNCESFHLYSLDVDGLNYVRSITLLHRYDKMLPSSYGLTCLYSRRSVEKTMVVFNPITQQTMALTRMPPQKYAAKNYLTGFGFDPRTNQYKVVVLSPLAIQIGNVSAHVLTLQPGRPIWRPVSCSFIGTQHSAKSLRIEFSTVCATAVCADGVLYWEAGLDFDAHNFDILSFDLQTETFRCLTRRIPKWNPIDPTFLCSHLINLQEKLCLSEVFRQRCHGERMTEWMIDIWMLMDSIRGDWMPFHKLNFKVEIHYGCFFPVCIRNGKVILRLSYPYGVEERLYSYDVEEKSLKDLEGVHFHGGHGTSCAHAETLASIS